MTVTLAEIEKIVGVLTDNQRHDVAVWLDDDSDGVLALAQRVASNPRVTSRAAVFITAGKRGDYRMPVEPERLEPVRVSPFDAFKRLYNAKWNDLARTGMSHAERVDYAMDYACSELYRCNVGPLPPGGVIALEDALRAELGEPRFR